MSTFLAEQCPTHPALWDLSSAKSWVISPRLGGGSGRPMRSRQFRADSAGCTEHFVAACRSRNVGFSVVCRSNRQIHSAIFDTLGFEELWHQAITQNGEDVREQP